MQAPSALQAQIWRPLSTGLTKLAEQRQARTSTRPPQSFIILFTAHMLLSLRAGPSRTVIQLNGLAAHRGDDLPHSGRDAGWQQGVGQQIRPAERRTCRSASGLDPLARWYSSITLLPTVVMTCFTAMYCR